MGIVKFSDCQLDGVEEYRSIVNSRCT